MPLTRQFPEASNKGTPEEDHKKYPINTLLNQ